MPGVAGTLRVDATHPSARLFTPHALAFEHPMMRRVVYRKDRDAVISDGCGGAVEYQKGIQVAWEYESQRDLLTLVSNDVYSVFRYTYDEAGRRVSKNDELYQYNERGELVSATNVVTDAEFVYCYDDIGNRLWSRELGTNCTYIANELNQYTNIVRGGVFELSAFDLDGNQTNIVTSTGEWSVEYNGENRPIRWHRASDDTTIIMSYDRKGRRVKKNDEAFVYDGYLNITETIWEPAERVATRPLLIHDDTKTIYFCHDGNKNVVNEVQNGGSSVFSYSTFGVLDEGAGSIAFWRFSSEFFDRDLDLIYYNYRHYIPTLGRWLQRDVMRNQEDKLYLASNNAILRINDVLGLFMDVVEHDPGESPKEGLPIGCDCACAIARGMEPMKIDFKNCNGNKFKLKASFNDFTVHIYYRTEEDVAPGRPAEYDHVECFRKYHDTVKITVGVVNMLPCLCLDEARGQAVRALERFEKTREECDECNGKLDAKGGPHGH